MEHDVVGDTNGILHFNWKNWFTFSVFCNVRETKFRKCAAHHR